ncbi:sugar ABC transporter ATP-binding protein [Acidisoma cladoniae]|uniref:sugar ABC transporter ATP-binding protein n=1 Tax=Acidisoma cladoniae TaxID=3040935 RepID=UPI00254A5645|nr:sugar ABC transporter ATP-binding protein [Acidisoma sp. PAMC 29798]
MDAPAPSTPILELRQVDKRFVGTHALKQVDLSFRAGEIHAIVGENGAGKSTLIKILTGAHVRSAGTILWQGNEVALASPLDAISLGINAVHQEVVLCPHLTVAANIFLGDERAHSGFLRNRAMVAEAQKLLDDLGFDLPATAMLGDLAIGQQQLVATARAAARGVKFLIFDEPTGYLTRQDTDRLFTLIRRLNAEGVTIVYISHRMEEIFQLADRVSVLRDGQLVATHVVAETNERELIRDMVARNIEDVHYKEQIPAGEILLDVEGLSGPGFHDVSLTVRRGEVVGLYGLIGAGRSEFVQCLFGRTKRSAGHVKLRGETVVIRHEGDAIARGIALVPESRRDQGLCLNMGVGFNLNLPVFGRISPAGLVDTGAEKRGADKQIADLRIVAASASVAAATLSGGNQQKIVVGKWLNHGAELFIFDEPTVGVDVGTKVEIYKVFAALLKRGAGIILISSYLPEVYDLSDRLHVFRRGTLVASHEARAVHPEIILTEAIGV